MELNSLALRVSEGNAPQTRMLRKQLWMNCSGYRVESFKPEGGSRSYRLAQ